LQPARRRSFLFPPLNSIHDLEPSFGAKWNQKEHQVGLASNTWCHEVYNVLQTRNLAFPGCAMNCTIDLRDLINSASDMGKESKEESNRHQAHEPPKYSYKKVRKQQLAKDQPRVGFRFAHAFYLRQECQGQSWRPVHSTVAVEENWEVGLVVLFGSGQRFQQPEHSRFLGFCSMA
jgi:hypothetical protein